MMLQSSGSLEIGTGRTGFLISCLTQTTLNPISQPYTSHPIIKRKFKLFKKVPLVQVVAADC
jgi:hypothetical protein